MVFEALVYLLLAFAIIISPLIWFALHVALPVAGFVIVYGVAAIVFIVAPVYFGLFLLRPRLPARGFGDVAYMAVVAPLDAAVVMYSMCWFWAIPWPANYRGPFFDIMRALSSYVARVPVVWPLRLIERVSLPYVPRNFAVGIEAWVLLFIVALVVDIALPSSRRERAGSEDNGGSEESAGDGADAEMA
ncbi:MAG: hypothetical protein K6V73_06385 [Firmicutes bacterium]|nr:hypothetical protein [Bacillota bacterium]